MEGELLSFEGVPIGKFPILQWVTLHPCTHKQALIRPGGLSREGEGAGKGEGEGEGNKT